LREGYRNCVLDEYLACICARAGRLHEALAAGTVDRALLDGAAGILRAMIAGGPGEDIDDYEHAPEAAERYVDRVWAERALGLEHFLALVDLRRYLDDAGGKSRWSGEARERVLAVIQDSLARPEWRAQAEQGLRSGDRRQFAFADQAAAELGIDTWAIHFERVRAAPLESTDWYDLLKETDDARIDEVLDFASSALPVERVATGPAEELGMGPGWELHSALNYVVQALAGFPNRGWRFIAAALQSPVRRNRHLATRALAVWSRDQWPEGAEQLLTRLLTAEPDEGIRTSLSRLLEGLPLG
jgi:hypothetical protein